MLKRHQYNHNYAHSNHHTIFDNRHAAHWQIKHIAQACALYLPFVQHALEDANNTDTHDNQGDNACQQWTPIHDKCNSKRKLRKSIDIGPNCYASGEHIIHEIALSKTSKIQQFKK